MVHALKDMNLAVPEILFGLGAIGQLGNRVKSFGASKVMIITDEGVAAAGIPDRVLGILEKNGIACGVFGKVEKEPSIENVERAFKEASGDFVPTCGGSGRGQLARRRQDGRCFTEIRGQPSGLPRSRQGSWKRDSHHLDSDNGRDWLRSQ
jgi:Iron-containing alcohol dehydrogenase